MVSYRCPYFLSYAVARGVGEATGDGNDTIFADTPDGHFLFGDFLPVVEVESTHAPRGPARRALRIDGRDTRRALYAEEANAFDQLVLTNNFTLTANSISHRACSSTIVSVNCNLFIHGAGEAVEALMLQHSHTRRIADLISATVLVISYSTQAPNAVASRAVVVIV